MTGHPQQLFLTLHFRGFAETHRGPQGSVDSLDVRPGLATCQMSSNKHHSFNRVPFGVQGPALKIAQKQKLFCFVPLNRTSEIFSHDKHVGTGLRTSSGEVPQQVPKQIPEHVRKQVPDQVPKQVPEQVCEQAGSRFRNTLQIRCVSLMRWVLPGRWDARTHVENACNCLVGLGRWVLCLTTSEFFANVLLVQDEKC